MISLLCPDKSKNLRNSKKILTLFVSGQQGFYNDSGMVRIQKCIVKIKIPDKFQGFFIKL